MLLTQVKLFHANNREILENRVNSFLRDNTTVENELFVESFQYVNYKDDDYVGSLTYTIKKDI